MKKEVRSFILAIFTVLLGACTTTPDRAPSPDQAHLRALGEVAQALPGVYSNHMQWRQGASEAAGPYTLEVRRDGSGDPRWLRILLAQSAAGEATRRFALELTPGARPDQFQGQFLPLGTAGALLEPCNMNFTLVSAGFSGETDPLECRFGEGDQAVGLLKEIAFDGQQIVIADQLYDPASRTPLDDVRTLRFFRERRFHGWAGVRQGDSWRLASELVLHSEGDQIVPEDADGRSLGLRLQLARVLWREDQPPILRLSVYDEATGQLLGYSWADPDATQLGINLPDFQAGLTAAPQ